MIVVHIHLLSARTGKATLLGQMEIANDGRLTELDSTKGNYVAAILRKPNFERKTKETVVSNWPRHRKTVWQLVQRALNQLYPQGKS